MNWAALQLATPPRLFWLKRNKAGVLSDPVTHLNLLLGNF